MSIQYYNIILKNTTSSGITIPDLSGLTIPASGTRDITDIFPFDRLVKSEDMDGYITNSGIVLNVEGNDLDADRARIFLSYHDATYIQGVPIAASDPLGRSEFIPENGELVLKYDRELEMAGLGSISFLELVDSPTTYTGIGNSVIINEAGDGLTYGEATASSIIASLTPPASGTNNIWFNLNDNAIYYYDESRLEWLSVVTHTYLYTYNAAISAAFMTVGNVSTSFAHFSFTRPACIVAINAHGDSGNASKGFELTDRNTEYVYKTFYMTNYEYYNNAEDVELDTGAELQIYVRSEGQGIKYPIIQLEIKWRYEAP